MAKQIKIKPTQQEKIRLGKALDDIEAALNGTWAPLAEQWQRTPAAQRKAEKAPLLVRLAAIAERLR